MPTEIEIAKTINDPRSTQYISREKLEELQDISFSRLKSQEQASLILAAKYIKELFERETIGYAVANAGGTHYRSAEYSEDECTVWSWTDSLDKALLFARKADAEAFARDDEDAWCIVRVVFKTGAIGVGPARTPTLPILPDTPAGGIGAGAPEKRVLSVDRATAGEALRLFAAFVALNARQWVLGSYDHHHPMWEFIAGHIDDPDVTSGPDWEFIQPENRERYPDLVEKYVDAHK